MLAVVNNKLRYINDYEVTNVDVDMNKILYPYYDGVLIQEHNYVTNISGRVISMISEEPIIYMLISNTLKYYMVTDNAVYSDEEKILDYSLPKHTLIYDDIGKFSYYDGHIFYIGGYKCEVKGSLFEHSYADRMKTVYFSSYDLKTGLYGYTYNYKNSELKCEHIGFKKEIKYVIKFNYCIYINHYFENEWDSDEEHDIEVQEKYIYYAESLSDIYVYLIEIYTHTPKRYNPEPTKVSKWLYNKFTNMIYPTHKEDGKIIENSYQTVVTIKGISYIYSKMNKDYYSNNKTKILDEITYGPQPKSARS